jgi:hypothetical protein
MMEGDSEGKEREREGTTPRSARDAAEAGRLNCQARPRPAHAAGASANCGEQGVSDKASLGKKTEAKGRTEGRDFGMASR